MHHMLHHFLPQATPAAALAARFNDTLLPPTDAYNITSGSL